MKERMAGNERMAARGDMEMICQTLTRTAVRLILILQHYGAAVFAAR